VHQLVAERSKGLVELSETDKQLLDELSAVGHQLDA
jgi:hypothetical protein